MLHGNVFYLMIQKYTERDRLNLRHFNHLVVIYTANWVSNASKKTDIPKARKSLGMRLQASISNRKERKAKALERLFGEDLDRCPCCQKGKMKTIGILPPERAPPIKAQKAHP